MGLKGTKLDNSMIKYEQKGTKNEAINIKKSYFMS